MKPYSGISRFRASRPVPPPQGERPAGRVGPNHSWWRSHHAFALARKTSKKACQLGWPENFEEIVRARAALASPGMRDFFRERGPTHE